MNWLTKILALLTALQNSPALLAWLNDLLGAMDKAPSNALPSIDANDPKLVEAFKQSPEVQQALDDGHVPQGAQGLGAGGLATFISLLPTLLELIRALRKGNAGTVK